MTNKINSIDVSECGYFEKQHIEDMYESDDCNVCIDNFCTLYWKECEKHNGCYFKQLKRLQEENKRLQMLSCANCGEKYLSPDGAELYEKNVQLQKENEELKEKIYIYESSIIANHDRAVGKRLMEVLLALEEIKNITEKLITELPEYNSCYYKDECGDNCTPKQQSKVEYCCYENVDMILSKINEVLNDRD